MCYMHKSIGSEANKIVAGKPTVVRKAQQMAHEELIARYYNHRLLDYNEMDIWLTGKSLIMAWSGPRVNQK